MIPALDGHLDGRTGRAARPVAARAVRVLVALGLTGLALGLTTAPSGAVIVTQAIDDSARTLVDTPVTINVLSNDRNVPTNYYLGWVSAFNGGLSGGMSDGVVTYRPRAGFVGTDTFGYTIYSGEVALDSASVTITVVRPSPSTTTTTRVTTTTTRRTTTTRPALTTTRAPRPTTRPVRTTPREATSTPPTTTPAAPPQAVDDVAGIAPGTPVVIRVLDNDTAPGGALDPSSVTIVVPPAAGEARVNPDGTITFVTDAGTPPGPQTFTYRVTDLAGRPATATVTVQVTDPTQIDVGDGSAPPGGSITVAGGGCTATPVVTVSVDEVVQVTTRADAAGRFQVRVDAPERIGRHRVRARCGDLSLETPLDVVLVTSRGASAAAPAAAAGLVAVGGVMGFYLLSGFLLVPSGVRRPEDHADGG